MKDLLSLRQRALLIIILPTIVIGILLGGYVTYKRYSELDQYLIDRGTFLAEPLALLSANAIDQNKRGYLKEAIDLAHLKASQIVRSITVFLPDHQLYLSTNYENNIDSLRLPPGKLIPDNTKHHINGDKILVRTPILGPEQNADSFMFIKKNGRTLYGYLVVELGREQAQLDQQKSIFILIGMLSLGVFVSAVFAFSFVRHIVKPLKKLNKAVVKIKNGETKTKITEPMMGELELLKVGVNALAKEIYKANERAEHNISEYTQELQSTVEQLEIQNIEINMAKRDAQQANEVKSQFLANMSHELRTPLNGVLGFTRQLQKTSLNANQRDFLETIEVSAQNLLRIINGILDFSKLDAGMMELEEVPFSLRDMTNEVMNLLAPNVFENGLDVHLAIASDVPDALLGDVTHIKQVVINLIGNAIKFTHQGYVRLDIEYMGREADCQRIKFIISDTGVGIDEQGKNKLFAAFGQADSSVTRKFGGTGLGLIISKKLIQAMGGDIHFESELGKGSRFFFDVCLKASPVAVAQPLPLGVLADKHILYFDSCEQSRTDISYLLTQHTDMRLTLVTSDNEFSEVLAHTQFDMVLIGRRVSPGTVGELKHLIFTAKTHCPHVYTIINSISPNMKEAFIGSGASLCLNYPVNHKKLFNALAAPYISQSEPETSSIVSFAGRKVLAVDDNVANLKLLEALLAEMSITTDTAMNGQEAVNKANRHKYDVIFMDIQMPIMDGVTACRLIKESSLNENTAIISVTAHAAIDEQKAMQDVGFADFLAKPIDEEMLTQILLEVCTPSQAALDGTIEVHKQEEIQLSQNDNEYAHYYQVDWPLALKRAAGKQDLAIEMLSALIKTLPETIEQLNQSLESNDYDGVLATIHKFHGACCYTGVPKLKGLAEDIETGLKREKTIKAVEPELFELLDELERVNSESKSWKL